MKRLLPLIALPASLFAAELPPPVIPAGVGVNIHFTRGHEADLDMIAAAGFKFVRMDFTWQGIERKKGEYDWSAYDELTANLEKRGLRALYILDYSNPLYEETITVTDKRTTKERRDTASPQRPESVEAFARWAGAAAKQLLETKAGCEPIHRAGAGHLQGRPRRRPGGNDHRARLVGFPVGVLRGDVRLRSPEISRRRQRASLPALQPAAGDRRERLRKAARSHRETRARRQEEPADPQRRVGLRDA